MGFICNSTGEKILQKRWDLSVTQQERKSYIKMGFICNSTGEKILHKDGIYLYLNRRENPTEKMRYTCICNSTGEKILHKDGIYL
jgi:hypothetical protein